MSERGIAGPNSSKTLLQGAVRGLQKSACWHPVGDGSDFLRSLWLWASPRGSGGKDGPDLWVAILLSLWWKHTLFAPDVPEAVGWQAGLSCLHLLHRTQDTLSHSCPSSCQVTQGLQSSEHNSFFFFLTFESYTRTILLLNWVSVEASRPGEWKIAKGVCWKSWKAYHNGRNPCKGLNYHTRWRQLWIPLAAVA